MGKPGIRTRPRPRGPPRQPSTLPGDKVAVTAHRQEIDRLEHEADRIKNEIRSNLPKRMFLAVERRDMLEILDYQDSIADVAQDIAELADMRGMVVPEELAPVFHESSEYLAERGIEIRRNVCREQARAVLDQYAAGGAPIYNR